MAGENLEMKAKEASETGVKISQIDTELSTLEARKKILEQQKDTANEPEIQKFIDELTQLEQSITKLKAEREALTKETQANLKWAVSKQQQEEVTKKIADSDLSDTDKANAQKAIQTNNFSFLDEITGEWGILAIIMSIFKWLFWWNNDSENSDFMAPYVEWGKPITEAQKLEFTKQAKKEAQKLEEKYWIPWEVSLSQCILESGWWQSKLAREHGNYFWIKWKWVAMMTKEDYAWKLQDEMASFRTYNNMEESFESYAKFLIDNPRYKEAFNYGWKMLFWVTTNYQWRDPIKFITEIKKAWYATDSNYVWKIAGIMKSVEKSNV